VVLKQSRSTAQDLGIEYIAQVVPRLIEGRYGPVLVKVPDSHGLYEFTDPVFALTSSFTGWKIRLRTH
jgi:hypothetical protein